MRILIMGAGAMGSVVGGFMARAGHTVTLVGRAPHMQAIASSGLRIAGIWGDHTVDTLETRTHLDGIGPDWDSIIVTVKSYDTAAAARAIAPITGPDTLVYAYQNGLGNAEALAEAVGWERVVGVRAIYGVWMPAPGHAVVTVIAQPTALGVYDELAPVNRVRAMAEAMDAAGLPTVYTDRIATVVWQKVAYNCALNPLSALLDVPYGALLDTDDTRGLLRDIVAELYAVGHGLGIVLDPGTPEAYTDLLFGTLVPPTAAHYASMREDFRRKRRTEIDALNGAICRYGEAAGVVCPVNLALTRLVRAREARYLR
jgi:2-dehydropantoate 2-reductase